MLRLNKDVLFLVIEELQNDRKSLYSCLLVDRTWCEITIPLLWKNPWESCPINSVRNILLFNIILSHLSEESRENLKDLYTVRHQQPLFNYISFCRYLNLYILGGIILDWFNGFKESKRSIIRNEIMRLFINRNTRFTHLYLNSHPYFQIHHISGAEHCFSELIFLKCDINDKNQNDLERLARISKSIETLELISIIRRDLHKYNPGIIRLIEAQKNLNVVKSIHKICEATYKALEESLIKHADTLKYLQIQLRPTTKVLSCLVNLISLDLSLGYTSTSHDLNWSHLENAYLPVLKILKASWVPHKSLASLIENTKGQLAEISIVCTYPHNSPRIIQSIYQNCPNLKYLRFHLIFNDSNISEFEKLLINCQCLNGLFIASYSYDELNNESGWDDLFKILTKSSPTGLFKFKFHFDRSLTALTPKLESFKLFFDNWRGRHPMLLQTILLYQIERRYLDLIEKYKMERIIKKYDEYTIDHINLDQFGSIEWVD